MGGTGLVRSAWTRSWVGRTGTCGDGGVGRWRMGVGFAVAVAASESEDDDDAGWYCCHCRCLCASWRWMLRPGWCRDSLDIGRTSTGLGMVGSPVNVRSRCCVTRMTLSRAGCMATLSCCCVRLVHHWKGSAASQSSYGLAGPRVVGGVCMFLCGSPWWYVGGEKNESRGEMCLFLMWSNLVSFYFFDWKGVLG